MTFGVKIATIGQNAADPVFLVTLYIRYEMPSEITGPDVTSRKDRTDGTHIRW